jgi:hypothetical protein
VSSIKNALIITSIVASVMLTGCISVSKRVTGPVPPPAPVVQTPPPVVMQPGPVVRAPSSSESTTTTTTTNP